MDLHRRAPFKILVDVYYYIPCTDSISLSFSLSSCSSRFSSKYNYNDIAISQLYTISAIYRRLALAPASVQHAISYSKYLIRGRRGRLRVGRSENCGTVGDRRARRPPSRCCSASLCQPSCRRRRRRRYKSSQLLPSSGGTETRWTRPRHVSFCLNYSLTHSLSPLISDTIWERYRGQESNN